MIKKNHIKFQLPILFQFIYKIIPLRLHCNDCIHCSSYWTLRDETSASYRYLFSLCARSSILHIQHLHYYNNLTVALRIICKILNYRRRGIYFSGEVTQEISGSSLTWVGHLHSSSEPASTDWLMKSLWVTLITGIILSFVSPSIVSSFLEIHECWSTQLGHLLWWSAAVSFQHMCCCSIYRTSGQLPVRAAVQLLAFIIAVKTKDTQNDPESCCGFTLYSVIETGFQPISWN